MAENKERSAESLAMLYGAGLLTKAEYENKKDLLNGTAQAAQTVDKPDADKDTDKEESMVLPILISVVLVLAVLGAAAYLVLTRLI